MVTPRPFNAPVGASPRVTSLGQVERDAAVAAERLRQMQSARNAVSTARTVAPAVASAGRGLGLLRMAGLTTPQGIATNVLAFGALPAIEAWGRYRKSPQGVLLGDRLREGNIGGLLQGIFSPRAAQANPLQQANPPGFDPNKPVSGADLISSIRAVAGSGAPGSDFRGGSTLSGLDRPAVKQYEATPESQFQRLFTDRAVGGYGDLSKGAPKNEQAMLELARQTSAPTGTPLNVYYAAQRGAGEVRKDQLAEYFSQKSPAMGEWAKANTDLAYRQWLKESSRGGQMDAGTTAALESIGKAAPSAAERTQIFLNQYNTESEDLLAPKPIGGYSFNF